MAFKIGRTIQAGNTRFGQNKKAFKKRIRISFFKTTALIFEKAHMNSVENKTVNKTRAFDADFLKAISIFAVVFIHGASALPLRPPYLDVIYSSLRFCVPVFIFFWALFAERALEKRSNKAQYLSDRFSRLLIPFVFWSAIYFCLIADFSTLTYIKFLTMHWAGNGWAGQYYFIILFQLIPLFTLLSRTGRQLAGFELLIIGFSFFFYVAVSYSNLFGISLIGKLGERPFIYWLPYVFLGIICVCNKNNFITRISIPVAIGYCAPILIPLEVYLIKPPYASAAPYMLPSVFIATLLLINSVVRSDLSSIMNIRWLNKFVGVLAANTLSIFCINPLVTIVLKYLFKEFYFKVVYSNYYIILSMLSAVFIIFVCVGLSKSFKKIGLGVFVSN